MLKIKKWLSKCFLLLVTATGIVNAQEASLVLPVGHSCPVAKIIYTADSKYLFSLGEDGSAKLWETESGLLVHDFKAIGDASMVTVSDACFDRAGKNLVLTYEGSIEKIWELSTGKFQWDTIFFDPSRNIENLANQISPSGDHIINFGIEEAGYPTKVYDKDGKDILTIKAPKVDVRLAGFSNNGKQIFTINNNGMISLWNSASGKLIQSLQLPENMMEAASFSPDDQTIFITSEGDHFIYNIAKNKLKALAANIPASQFNYIRFSQDSRYAGFLYSHHFNSATTNFKQYYDSVIIWDISTGKQILRKGDIYLHSSDDIFGAGNQAVAGISNRNTLVIQNSIEPGTKSFSTDAGIAAYCYSPNNKYLAIIDDKNKYYLFETATSKKLINGELLQALNEQKIFDITISNNGALAFACNEYIVSYPSFQQIDQKEYTSYSSKLPVLLDANFLADNQTIEIKTLDGFYYWNSSTGNINFEAEMQVDTRNSFAYTNQGDETSPDGSASLTFMVDIISVTKPGTDIFIYHRGLKETIRSAHFSPDSKKVILTMQNNSIKVVDLAQKKMLFNLFPLKSAGFIVTDVIEDSLGYNYIAHFDGSDAARKQLYLACGTEIITLDQLKDLIWVPNLASRLIKGESIQAKSLSELDICGYLPLVNHVSNTATEDVYQVTARRGGLGQVVLLINGTPTKTYQSNELVKKGNVYSLTIPKKTLTEYFVEGNENKITIKAFAADNTTAARGVSKIVVVNKTVNEPPNLFAVLIGVSNYKGNALKLRYAAKDATAFSNVLRASAGKFLNSDTSNHVFIYNMTTQEDRYQMPEKKAIRSLLQSIGTKAKPNDILVIFFAGHGVMAKDSSGSQFYFLTSEASTLSSDSKLVKDVGISTNELAEWMAPVHMKAQKRILIFDACNSGQAIRDMVSVGADNQGFIAARNDDAAQQIKAIDKLNEKSGLFILSASASDQNAYESSAYEQGFLTYALLKAIKERPDILDNGQLLDVSRWFNAAKDYVGDIAKNAGERQEPQIITNTNFNIGIVDDEVRNKINLAETKFLFTGSNFQNSDDAIADDNLNLNAELNQQLQKKATADKAPFIFSVVSVNKDAYALSGRYTLNAESIIVVVNLKKGRNIKQRFEVTGQLNDLKKLAADIISKAVELIAEPAQ